MLVRATLRRTSEAIPMHKKTPATMKQPQTGMSKWPTGTVVEKSAAVAMSPCSSAGVLDIRTTDMGSNTG